MNKIAWIIVVFLAVSCVNSNKPDPVKLTGEAQGTYYSITYYDSAMRDYQFEIDSLLDDFDLSLSLWVPESVLSRINRNDTTVRPDKYFRDNLKLSQKVATLTNGAFDVTVGPLVKAWGFGFDETKHVDSLIVDSILQFVGHDKITVNGGRLEKSDPRVSIDFNAIAQGYSVDLVGSFLEKRGITNYLVDIGGEVKAKGQKPDGSLWKVGIEKPAEHKDDERTLKAIIALKDKSIATSGNYRKFYVENGIRYSHTIDPKTGYPVQHSLLSASVIASKAAVADAFATAFMVMGFDETKKFVTRTDSLEVFLIYSNSSGRYQSFHTAGFGALLTKEFE